MGTPKKRYKYGAIYTDGSFITYELTREDYAEVEKQLFAEQPFASISLGILGLKDIRSLIEQKDVEQVEEQEVNDSELPVLDQESYNWIRQYMGGKE